MTPASFTLPTIELLPLYGAIAVQRAMTLDVLIRITPQNRPQATARSPLNLSLVIDRSGSMSGPKIEQAIAAACFAVENLLPSDRLSVVLFCDRVETLIPSTLATDKPALLQTIRQIRAGGSTALHAGWVEGGLQAGQYLNPHQLNRIVVLSDGKANVGETYPDAIADDVHGLAQRGISTSTLGIGQGYNEDLLAAMAASGDGNFFHIESADQLPEIFETELSGLTATLGQQVTLDIQPQHGAKVLDVLNDFDRTATQQYQLPNLVIGAPINVVARLQVPALTTPTNLLTVQLSWHDVQASGRLTANNELTLPVVTAEQFSDFPANPTVQEQVALLMVARARQEAIAHSDAGNLGAATSALQSAQRALKAMPMSPNTAAEQAALDDLEQDYARGDTMRARKKALSQAYNLSRRGASNPRSSMESK
ncbi:MAG: VWA domain-containing protein [Leptolyngbyaceae cyanobacterium]